MATVIISGSFTSQSCITNNAVKLLTEKGYLFDNKKTIPALIKINRKNTFFADFMGHQCANDDVIEYQVLAGAPTASVAITNSLAGFFGAAKALVAGNALLTSGAKFIASLVVNKLVAHFTKPPDSIRNGNAPESDNVYAFSGGQNVIASGQPKALLHGQRKGFYPEIPHSDFVYLTYEDGGMAHGNPFRRRSHQMLNMLLFIGLGDCAVSKLGVEDTPFQSLKNAEWEVIPPSGDISNFPRLIPVTELNNLELQAWNEEGGTAAYTANAGWIGKNTGIIVNPWGSNIDTVYVSVEFLLAKAHNTDPTIINSLTANVDIQTARVDKDGALISSWKNIVTTTDQINQFSGSKNLSQGQYFNLLGDSTFGHDVYMRYSERVESGSNGNYSNQYSVVKLSTSNFEINTAGSVDRIRVNTLPSRPNNSSLDKIYITKYTYVTPNYFGSSGLSHTGADLTPYTKEISIPVQTGRYAIRIRRSDEKDLSVSAKHIVRLVGVKGRSVREYDNSDCTLLRVKLQASKQLSSQSSNKIKVDAHYKNSSGGVENRASVLIKRLINGAEGVYDSEQIHANYPALSAFQTELNAYNAHVNCRLVTQKTIKEFIDEFLSEIRSVMYVKSARLEFARESYPSFPVATFTSDKVHAGSLSENFNLANDNKAGVIVGHYWDNDDRRQVTVKLKPEGSLSDIETEVQLKYISSIKDAVRQLHYIAQSNIKRVIPNSITLGEEALDLKIGDHINIALPRISETQSVQVDAYTHPVLLVNVEAVIDNSKNYEIVFLDRFNAPTSGIAITGVDGRYLTLAGEPTFDVSADVSTRNRTRAVIIEIGYEMERRLVSDIQPSNSDNNVVCEVSTIDDYPEVHSGNAQVWIDSGVIPFDAAIAENGSVQLTTTF